MALKKKGGGGGGANWMDTYGDMVTLLLCFFVLLYSMSTISTENWKAIVQSFNPTAVETPTATTGAGGPDADHEDMGGEMPQEKVDMTQEEVDQDIESLFQALQAYVESQVSQSIINVEKSGGKVYIRFNNAVFFGGNSAILKQDSYAILDDVGAMLNSVSASVDEVRVQGHTAKVRDTGNTVDNDRTLASLRATNVVIYLQQHGVLDGGRLISEGIGEWQPLVPNDTAEHMAQNRRVEMIVSGRDIEAEMEEAGMTQDFTEEYYTTTQ
ncbi:MAG: flagellar motor protein MotB [Oscillibacter sp.]|nr:flagellar motor protein MotB [Oscillibacter sp.]